MMKKLSFFFVFIFSIYFSQGQNIAPEVIANGGDYFESSQISVSWTVGELAVETYIGSNNILTQGFQQPEMGLSSIKEDQAFSLNIYPNPAEEYINIEVGNNTLPAEVFVYDINGKLVNSFIINDKLVKVSLEGLDAGTYFIKLRFQQKESTYKFVKSA